MCIRDSLEEFRRNPNVKFEYHDEPAPMAEEPTRYMDKVAVSYTHLDVYKRQPL